MEDFLGSQAMSTTDACCPGGRGVPASSPEQISITSMLVDDNGLTGTARMAPPALVT
jgi:hypothetical protein